ncbi:MAG TPA: hypothetical protein PLK94_11305 [Alphaproteobacteria bacterium]|nr:hypothetical protein [Alphaproteobacteria bacterium]HOO51864.1 hypothetical protein [Alphaproteobacteria bacterium]
MNDMLKEFGDSRAQMAGAPDYQHPQSDIILEECQELLAKLPEGKRLLEAAKEKGFKYQVITGKIPDFHVTGNDTLVLVCPANTKAVDLEEMACNMGMGIRALEQPHVGFQKPQFGNDSPQNVHAVRQHFLDITIEMCIIVSEIYDANNNSKIVDLLDKLGHRELYEAYRSGKSKEEMAEIYFKSVNAVT